MDGISEVTILMEGKGLEGSNQQLEQLLNQVGGIDSVLIDAEHGEVKIRFDNTRISKERIIITLNQHDFQLMQ